MASKHAKLKLALTRTIIDFFLQEDLYADELKIQGTVCVTADRSAIFVTQITETVNEGLSQDDLAYSGIDPHHNFSRNEFPEDLTCKSNLRQHLALTPPAAHTKSHQPLGSTKTSTYGNPPDDTYNSLIRFPTKHEWSHEYSLKHASDLSQEAEKDLSGFSQNSTPCLQRKLIESDKTESRLLTLNSAILNAAARSAIERLTSLNRDSENIVVPKVPVLPDSWPERRDIDQSKENNLITDIEQNQLNHNSESALQEVIDCSSAKKRRLECPPNFSANAHKSETATSLHTVLSSDPDLKDKNFEGDLVIDTDGEEPLMLVTPKQEKVSDDEVDTERDSVKSQSSPNRHGSKKYPANSQNLSPNDINKKQVSPSESGNSSTAWTFTVASMKEEPGTLITEWSSADWMRKPRTKFSQDQLQALENEYKNDPFLSTSADKRAELARRLKITEKNVQIWFQNQRRRRRAAAYSQMHYALDDAKASGFNSNDNEVIDVPPGSPDLVSDQEEASQFDTNTNEKDVNNSKDQDNQYIGQDLNSTDENSVSELVIATDLSVNEKDSTSSQESKNDQSTDGKDGRIDEKDEKPPPGDSKKDKSSDKTKNGNPLPVNVCDEVS